MKNTLLLLSIICGFSGAAFGMNRGNGVDHKKQIRVEKIDLNYETHVLASCTAVLRNLLSKCQDSSYNPSDSELRALWQGRRVHSRMFSAICKAGAQASNEQ